MYEGRNDITVSEKQKNIEKDLVSEATEIVDNRTWRSTLLSLRAMFPGAGNYSGVGVPLDKEDSGMNMRLLDMRSAMVRVMKNSERKFGTRFRLTHSLTHSLTHLLTYLLTHSLTYLLTHSLTL